MSTLTLSLPPRAIKPRQMGLSNLVDNGYGLAELRDKLSLYADYIDIVKLGWASAYITSALVDKIELFRHFDIRTCLGALCSSCAGGRVKSKTMLLGLRISA